MDSWVLVKYIKLKRVFDEQVQVVHGIYDLQPGMFLDFLLLQCLGVQYDSSFLVCKGAKPEVILLAWLLLIRKHVFNNQGTKW